MFKKWDKYVLLHFVDNSNIKQRFSANNQNYRTTKRFHFRLGRDSNFWVLLVSTYKQYKTATHLMPTIGALRQTAQRAWWRAPSEPASRCITGIQTIDCGSNIIQSRKWLTSTCGRLPTLAQTINQTRRVLAEADTIKCDNLKNISMRDFLAHYTYLFKPWKCPR